MIGKFLTAIAATTLVAAPVAASANPAASLSVAKSARASTSSDKSSDLAGVGTLPLVLVAGIAAIGIIAIVNESDDDDFPDSN
ncbi:hypothetical protein ACBY01_06365 [Sphingomonas sp. ac-8]|uniref:hypothetical protein n=1 Tax=Sphingomonas sp. ac-8 TaxID=3242977 RepID=UPI003A80E00C